MADRATIDGAGTLTVLDPDAQIAADFPMAPTEAGALSGDPPEVWWLNINTAADPITGNSTLWWRGVAVSGSPVVDGGLRVIFKPSIYPAPQLPGDDHSIHYRPHTLELVYRPPGLGAPITLPLLTTNAAA